ncbi:hypothetical protein WME73_14915 [Sorangium sp. So ce302]|uniref:hypothetical protein n=1 Tax=Sorangium sp. So ce302 TaxID=3133297 RepID=UPI003F618FC3
MQMAAGGAMYTRVAVAQLAYYPAIIVDRRSPIEDPLFDPRTAADSLLPARADVPDAIKPRLEALRRRIRETYDAQLFARIRAVLSACLEYGARIVVFPEYSIPWEILGGVADAAGDMVVVAGTHSVDRAARRSGIYERLGAGLPALGQSVCPVLHRGRLLGLHAKRATAAVERSTMRPGETWAPVEMPDGIPGPMGVLACLDFLLRDGAHDVAPIAERVGECRFLAVPSATPHTTLPELSGAVWEEARRYGRPTLYCDGAEGGGTSIYVDEAQAHELRRFPDRAGYLEPGDEGVIVADVDLRYERASAHLARSTRPAAPPPGRRSSAARRRRIRSGTSSSRSSAACGEAPWRSRTRSAPRRCATTWRVSIPVWSTTRISSACAGRSGTRRSGSRSSITRCPRCRPPSSPASAA